MHLSKIQKRSYKIAKDKGFWGNFIIIGEKILRIQCEVSEVAEEIRRKDIIKRVEYDDKGKPIGFAVELADIVLCTLQLAEHFDIDLEKVIEIKEKYNKTRPYKHGNKKF